MFYFFTPTKTHKREYEILREIEKRFNIDLKKYTYCYKFIYYDPDLEIYGGVFLHQRSLSSLLPMPLLKDKDPLVWVALDLFFEIENDTINECLEDFDWHYQNFFRQLYEQLTNFSITFYTEEIFTYFNEEEQEDSCLFGKWLVDWAAHFEGDKVLSHLTFNRERYHQYTQQFEGRDFYLG